MTPLPQTVSSFFDLFALPPALTVAEWAEEHRYLSRESSSKHGKWHALPWQLQPMDDVTNVTVRAVVLMWAAQVGGKTEIINNTIGFFIDHDPCPVLMLQPTVEMAESWSKEKFTPMLRDTPRLRGKVRDARSRDANNTILHKAYPGGHLTVVGANAPSGLAMRAIRVVVCDEVDRYPKSAGVEGDPIMLAKKRTESFWDAIEIDTSTPTVKGESRIEIAFEETDKNYFFVPCHACGHFQTLTWAFVKWPEGKPEDAYYECASCGEHWSDSQRQAAIWKGEWRPTAPFGGRRGYHLNGIYVLFKAQKGFKSRLHQMAVGFLEAKAGGRETLKTWTNTFLAETWEEEGEKPQVAPLLERCEAYGPVLPAGVLVLVAFGDVHPNRIEMETVGFGVGEESWGIRYDRFIGNPELPGVWQQVDSALQMEYEHPCGQKLSVAAAGFDTGHKTDAVYNFVRPRQDRRIFAMKGSGVPGSPIVSRPKKSGVRKVMLFMVGTDTAKGIVYSRLRLTEPGAGFMHFPIGYTEEYFNGLTAEKLTTEYRRGFPVRVWKCVPEGARNEPLDIRAGCLAVLKVLNPGWQALAKNLAITPPEAISKPDAENEPKAEPAGDKTVVPPIARPIMRRKSWVKSW